MTLRTLGRGFWIGIAASLLLHIGLFANGRFQLPRWPTEHTLEARLEPADFKAVTLPQPQVSALAIPSTPPASPPPAQAQIPEPTPVASPSQTEEISSLANTPSTPPARPAEPTKPTPAEPETATPAAQVARSLKQLPARIEIVFELNGMVSGRQIHRWRRDEQRYWLETEGEVNGLASLFIRGKLIQISKGKIGSVGLMPEHYEMQRLSGKKEILKFDYDGNIIESSRIDSKGKRTLELPLLSGAQDPLSAIYQLSMAAQDNDNGFIVAAGTKRIKGYPYRVLGKERLNTALGTLLALHVSRAGDSGNSNMHLWLSSEHHYLPVKVSYADEDGTEWVLEATRLNVE